MSNGTTYSAIGSIIGAASNFYSGYSSLLMTRYQEKLAKYTQKVIDARTRLQEARLDRELKKVIGAQRAKTAAGNIMPDVGTPLELQVESEILADIDKNLLRITGGMEKLEVMNQAMQYTTQQYGNAAKAFFKGASYLADESLLQFQRTPTTEGNNNRWSPR